MSAAYTQHLQALDDAIAYRTARMSQSCPDCSGPEAGQRCDDHACDLELIAAYQRTVGAVTRDVSRLIAAQRARIARTSQGTSAD
jgi:hypothetical protein